jgi:hypothetical protein
MNHSPDKGVKAVLVAIDQLASGRAIAGAHALDQRAFTFPASRSELGSHDSYSPYLLALYRFATRQDIAGFTSDRRIGGGGPAT